MAAERCGTRRRKAQTPLSGTFAASCDGRCIARNWSLWVDRWCGKVGQVDDPLRAREKNPPFFGNSSWLTTMLCVSISYAVNSWKSRSVSSKDKTSEMQTQIKVV